MLSSALERCQLNLCCKHNLQIHSSSNWLVGIMLVWYMFTLYVGVPDGEAHLGKAYYVGV